MNFELFSIQKKRTMVLILNADSVAPIHLNLVSCVNLIFQARIFEFMELYQFVIPFIIMCITLVAS